MPIFALLTSWVLLTVALAPGEAGSLAPQPSTLAALIHDPATTTASGPCRPPDHQPSPFEGLPEIAIDTESEVEGDSGDEDGQPRPGGDRILLRSFASRVSPRLDKPSRSARSLARISILRC